MTIRTLICLAVLAVVCGCSTARHDAKPAWTAPAVQPQRGQVWLLAAMRGHEVSRTDVAVTLELNPDAGTLKGSGHCNTYYADCRMRWLRGDTNGDRYSLTLTGLGSGTTQCPDPAMNADARYLALLAKADEALLTPYVLTLLSHGKEILRYELL